MTDIICRRHNIFHLFNFIRIYLMSDDGSLKNSDTISDTLFITQHTCI